MFTMPMAHFGETLKKLRNARGFSQPALGEMVGVSDQRISDWEQMSSASIRGYNYHKLAAALGMTVEQLDREWRPQGIPQSVGDPIRRGIPLINKAPAGKIIDYEECGADSGQGNWYIQRDGIEDPNAFGVVITGDSMSPFLVAGAVAIFSPMDMDGHTHFRRLLVKEGHVVYVRFSSDAPKEGCTVARLFPAAGGKIKLVKDNKKYKPISCETQHIASMAAMIRHDDLPGMTKTFHANEQLTSKGDMDTQVEGQVHPEY